MFIGHACNFTLHCFFPRENKNRTRENAKVGVKKSGAENNTHT